MKDLIPLPNWIKFSKSKGHYVIIDPIICQNPQCNCKWYPRINSDGSIDIPGTCPACRTKAYRTKRS